MMLQALLIDDEMNILRHLQSIIPWEQIGIEVAGLAQNGVVALERSKEIKPDIILCDIRHKNLEARLKDDYTQESRQWSESERKLWNFAICNVLQDALQEDGLHYAGLQMREGEWCFLIEQQKVSPEYELAQVKDWSNSLQVALKMPNKRESIIVSQDNPEKTDMPDSLWTLIEEMVSGLKQCDRVKTEKAQAALSTSLLAVSVQSYVRVQQILHYLVLHLVREMREMDIVTQATEEMIWKRLEQSMDIKDLLVVIQQIVDMALNNVLSKKTSDIRMLSAANYVQTNLSADLSIDELAGHLNISCSYFSLLFKQHFGETFLEYVTRERMELAKSMLRTSVKSVSQIGRLVGFPDRRYFTKVFMKRVGCTPSEYRAQP